MIIFVIGVAGAGKTAVGAALARCMNCDYVEADCHHSVENKAKMAQGQPLSDEDRLPWLHSLNQSALDHQTAGQSAVISCSALKPTYRSVLTQNLTDFAIVWLRVSIEQATARLNAREGHYFRAALLQTQFDALEPPNSSDECFNLLTVDTDNHSVFDIVLMIHRFVTDKLCNEQQQQTCDDHM